MSSPPAGGSASGTVAAFAPDDAGAFHTREADEAVAIGSYLDPAELIRAAREAGADAIHPGYGFLAENGDFAEAVGAAGLTFVGPSPAAIRAAGDKLEAKRLAREAGVPVVESGEPGELGFPLIVKAAAGGGGRGMRVVRSAGGARGRARPRRRARRRPGSATGASSPSATSSARATSRSRCSPTRHGTVVHLGERECSIQRRHQKVLEESPSPALDAELRAAMGEAGDRVRPRSRLRERGHRRVHARRRPLLVPGAERAAPGRASR